MLILRQIDSGEIKLQWKSWYNKTFVSPTDGSLILSKNISKNYNKISLSIWIIINFEVYCAPAVLHLLVLLGCWFWHWVRLSYYLNLGKYIRILKCKLGCFWILTVFNNNINSLDFKIAGLWPDSSYLPAYLFCCLILKMTASKSKLLR